MKRSCIECGDSFHGRSDAKFCSGQCRSNYHNRNNGHRTDQVRRINGLLRKNRKILQGLNPTGKSRVSKKDLTNAGFRFDYFTNVYRTKAGKDYFFVYDQGYIDTGDDWYTLVVKKEYV